MRAEIMAFTQGMKRIHDRIYENFYQKNNLSRLESGVLMYLYRNPGNNTARDFIQLHNATKSHVSKAIESLYEKGLLRCESDAADKRKTLLTLTPEAIAVAEAAVALHEEFDCAVAEGLSAEELDLFAAILNKMTANMRRMLDGEPEKRD